MDYKVSLIQRRHIIYEKLEDALNAGNSMQLLDLVSRLGEELIEIERELVLDFNEDLPLDVVPEEEDDPITPEEAADLIKDLKTFKADKLSGPGEMAGALSSYIVKDPKLLGHLRDRLRSQLEKTHRNDELRSHSSDYDILGDWASMPQSVRIKRARASAERIKTTSTHFRRASVALWKELYGVCCVYLAYLIDELDFEPMVSRIRRFDIAIVYDKQTDADDLDGESVKKAILKNSLKRYVRKRGLHIEDVFLVKEHEPLGGE